MGHMAGQVYLVRHAAHDRVDRVLCGRMPGVRLSESGRAQARRLGAWLAARDIAALYTSPSERCRQTATLLSAWLGLAPIVAPDLDEIDFGRWTGCHFAALAEDPLWRAWNRERDQACPPGGETMRAAQARACRGIAAAAARYPGESVALVSHADVIKSVVIHCLGLSLQAYERLEVSPGSASIVTCGQGGKLAALNLAPP